MPRFSAPSCPYEIERPIAGRYRLIHRGEVIGEILRVKGKARGVGGLAHWQVALDPERRGADRPAPFTEDEHRFGTFAAVVAWLGLI